MEFTKSQYFKSLDELIAERKYLQGIADERQEKEDKLRHFYNGRPTKTEQEAEETGEDVTNHLYGHARVHAVETALRSSITGKTTFIEIGVDTNNVEQDTRAGVIATQKLNRAINHRPKFFALFQSLAGELPIAGRAALVQTGWCGWCPGLARGILIAEDTPPLADEVPYAFIPRKLTNKKLSDLKRAKGVFVDTEAVDALTKWNRDKAGKKSTVVQTLYADGRSEDGEAVDVESGETGGASVSIKAWEFFEVHHDTKGCRVSSTLYVEEVPQEIAEKDTAAKKTRHGLVIAHDPKAYPSAEAWLTLLMLDAEVGGVKTWDSARGIAELCFPNDADVETMINASVEGAIMKARPRFTADPGQIDQLRKMNIRDDIYVPSFAKEFKFSADSGDLQQNIGMLSQNSAALSSTSTSNSSQGGELRVQALQRGQQNAASTLARLDCLYRYLQPLCEEIVRRFFMAPLKPGCEGYADIAWFRAQMAAEGIGADQLKMLGKQTYGHFDFLKIKVIRSVGEGDIGSQREIAEILVKNIGMFPVQARPFILQMWLSLVTNDQDLAERLITLPNLVISAGRVSAENERDTIMFRAAGGVPLPTGVDDIDQDHCESHLTDMKVLIATHSLQPWTKLTALGFAGLAVHTAEHVQNMKARTDMQGDANFFAANLEQIVASAQPIIDQIEEQSAQQAQAGQVAPEVSAELAIRREELLLRARDLGLKERQQDSIEVERNQKHALAARKQIHTERKTVVDQSLKKEQIDKQAAAKKAAAKKPAKKK